MIILDVDFNTFRSQQFRKFHINKQDKIEMYSYDGDFLYRYVYQKKTPEEDIIFITTNLNDSKQILNISNVNENEWRNSIVLIWQKLDELINLVRENAKI